MDIMWIIIGLGLLWRRTFHVCAKVSRQHSAYSTRQVPQLWPQEYERHLQPDGKSANNKPYLTIEQLQQHLTQSAASTYPNSRQPHTLRSHKNRRKLGRETLNGINGANGVKGINGLTLAVVENYTVPLSVTFHGGSLIPFNYRCQIAAFCKPSKGGKVENEDRTETDKALEALSTKDVDPCLLVRWNYELPFTEFPNMVTGLLAFDMISGFTMAEKSRFLLTVLKLALDSYMTSNSSAEIFSLPSEFQVDSCKFRRSMEPAMKSLYNLLNIYSARQTGSKLLFTLVKASKACLDKHGEPFPLELLPCLDFSLGVEQLATLQRHQSLFANPEICRKHLRYNISRCLADQDQFKDHPCSEQHLIALNAFARRYYQCPGTLDGIYGEITIDVSEMEQPDLADEYYDVEADVLTSSRTSSSSTLGSNGAICGGYLAALLAIIIWLSRSFGCAN